MSGVEPVRKEIVVEASAKRCFAVFTGGMDRWWPKEHHIGKSPLAKSVIEPKVGGRWYSVCEDATECEIGKVLAWEPPGRVVLAWQLTGEWQYDPNFITTVEVKFIEKGPKQTLVQFEHRDLHRYGVAAPQVRASIDAPGGWSLSLGAFAKIVAADEAAAG